MGSSNHLLPTGYFTLTQAIWLIALRAFCDDSVSAGVKNDTSEVNRHKSDDVTRKKGCSLHFYISVFVRQDRRA